MEDIISLSEISYCYHDSIMAVSDITFTVKQGERFAIIGTNGSGKSTLLQILNGLIPQSSGSYLFKGREVSLKTLKDKGFLRSFRESVGYVFQDSDVQLFCPTVLDELLYGPLQLDISEKDALNRADEVMDMLNITSLKDRPPHMLSGGEKKKVAIGSILTMNPDVMLLDEPTNGLDPRTQSNLLELMLILSNAGKTLVIATHDLSLVSELEAHVALLSEEHKLEKIGSADEILKDEDLLLKVNLIHEHKHYHGSKMHKHKHSHDLFHRHV